MVLKRPFGEGEGEGFTVANQEAKRRIASSNFAQNVLCGRSSRELTSSLEPQIRRWVRDEVECSFRRFFSTLPRSPFTAIEPCRNTSYQLRFQANLPDTFFTGSSILSKDNTAVKLQLFDINSNQIVSSGPFSSLKVEIVPLDGDFSADDEQDWSQNDFDAKVIYARDGRRPLVTGDLVVTLENGVADLGDFCFTDNSSWRRSRTFMIGARAKDTSVGVRIREARSQAFKVKDHRGESYKKHHPPSLGDDIWRLEKIAKDGVFHKRLASQKIRTVKDFLQMYATNRSLLRKLLGGSSNRTWETIVKHAKDCVLDDKLYKSATDGIGLLLDSVLNVVGATFDGQNYLPLDKLSMFQTPMVEASKQKVYKNLEGIVPINDPSVDGVLVPLSNLHHHPLQSATLGLQGLNISVLQQDELEMQTYGMVDNSREVEMEIHMGEYYSPALKNNGNGGYGEDVAAVGTSFWQGNELYIDPNNQTIDIFSSDFGICFSRNGSPRARWCKIRAALKWGSVRRDVAAKRMAQLESFLDLLV